MKFITVIDAAAGKRRPSHPSPLPSPFLRERIKVRVITVISAVFAAALDFSFLIVIIIYEK
jgi:hypothetical protein